MMTLVEVEIMYLAPASPCGVVHARGGIFAFPRT